VLADSVILMDKAEETWTAQIHFNLDMTRTERALLVELLDIFRRHPGSCHAYLHLLNPEKTETIIALPDSMTLKSGSALTRDVNRLLGYPSVETVCHTVSSGVKSNNFQNRGKVNHRHV
jgi:DNA polymerase-3 subunit alpha